MAFVILNSLHYLYPSYHKLTWRLNIYLFYFVQVYQVEFSPQCMMSLIRLEHLFELCNNCVKIQSTQNENNKH